MVTMEFIAKETGLSRYTVSKVLNGAAGVTERTRLLVAAACERHGFIPNRNAVGLVRGRTNLVGVVAPYITDDFYNEFIELLDHAASASGYQIVYRSSYNSSAVEADILKNFLALKVCGMVVVPVVEGPEMAVHDLAAKNVPVVYFDRPLDASRYHVVNDNRDGVFRMTELMISKGRSPAYLGSFYQSGNVTAALRERGYLEAMERHALPPRLVPVDNSREAQDNERFGYDNVKALVVCGDVPDALLCVTDAVALGAMRALNETGVVPGKDVLLAGHDNLRFGAFLTPSLSTIRQPKELFAQACVAILDRCLKDDPPAERKRMFIPELVLREST